MPETKPARPSYVEKYESLLVEERERFARSDLFILQEALDKLALPERPRRAVVASARGGAILEDHGQGYKLTYFGGPIKLPCRVMLQRLSAVEPDTRFVQVTAAGDVEQRRR